MDLKLELVIVPVADVDRAKTFYVEQVGFNLDVDHRAGESGDPESAAVGDTFRVVQMTPPGSACSITIGTGLGVDMPPGSIQGMHLVVTDIEAVRAELAERGVEVSEVFHFDEGRQVPGPDPERRDYGSFATFSDPDGNRWMLQEVGRNPS